VGRVTCDMAMSIDGFVAGPNQSLDNPLGEGIEDRLHDWLWEREPGDVEAIDRITAAGAFIMGRNMFGPVRGSWGSWEGEWRGWWGDEPPYHAPVFVLTHHPREPVEMQGGTTFTFVTDGIESALDQARAAAGEADVAVAGGAATARAYLNAGLIDELRLHVTPALVRVGERLLDGIDAGVRLEQQESLGTHAVTHLCYQVARLAGPGAGPQPAQ
jgi:dihydrofolate reductase